MRPPSKKINFYRDDIVEVCSKEQGFEGSYYEARVISHLDNGLYVVEYKNLLENDESGPLVETVYPKELRPHPPKISARGYALNEKVDAFDNDGWWVGKITGRTGLNYHVYFEYCDQEIAYPVSQLRVHQEFIHGKWVVDKKLRAR
ncbi:hypothetical protein L6164_018610 [Bauhinia variegata]|uniref:Uncharacterized protein n=1 Tax=Bauhinia variegata TaxID=167791 RepID=A0ACB9NBK2_BAUVA|nr:hypothetical protein L6164_018610 [Bauhinia variegata]